MVRKLKSSKKRKVVPLYYARLNAPAGFAAKGIEITSKTGKVRTDRAVFRVDDNNVVHVLYLPKSPKKGATATLRFTN